jgi:hypothetical protein
MIASMSSSNAGVPAARMRRSASTSSQSPANTDAALP